MEKLYRVESVKPIAFGLCDQVLKWSRKNRDVPVADYYEVLEDYDPKFGYLYNNLVDGFFTEEEATLMLECLSRISEDEIGISSMREVNYPLQFATDGEDEDLIALYQPISGTLELGQSLVALFPFEVNCNIGITQNFPGLKHLMGGGTRE